MIGVVIYGIVVRVHQVMRSKTRKYLREKYPNGFIHHGKIYYFSKDKKPESTPPYLSRVDDKKFKSSDIQDAGFIDCSFKLEGLISDCGAWDG